MNHRCTQIHTDGKKRMVNRGGRKMKETLAFLPFEKGRRGGIRLFSSSVHLRASVCICGSKPLFFFILSLFALSLSSCAELNKDTGLQKVPDEQLRSGPTGTLLNPAPLDPFKKYNLIMAGDECRYFVMKVPSQWYWKVFLTAVNREDGQEGKLTAGIAQGGIPWVKLPDADFSKVFLLRHEGVQGVLGIANDAQGRQAILELCQEGVPLKVTIESQIFSITGILGPRNKPKDQP